MTPSYFYYSMFLGQFTYHFSLSHSSLFPALPSIYGVAAKIGHRARAWRPLASVPDDPQGSWQPLWAVAQHSSLPRP